MTPAASGVFEGDVALPRLTDARVSLISQLAKAAGVPVDLALGVVWVESRFNPRARSGVGALGLMQLMPETYAEIAKQLKLGPDAYDEHDNVRAGVAFLSSLLKRWADKGSAAVCWALASYFAGAGNVKAKGWSPYAAYVRAVLYQRDRFAVALFRTGRGDAWPAKPGATWLDATCHTRASTSPKPSPTPSPRPSPAPQPKPFPSPRPSPQPSPSPASGGGLGLLLALGAFALSYGGRRR